MYRLDRLLLVAGILATVVSMFRLLTILFVQSADIPTSVPGRAGYPMPESLLLGLELHDPSAQHGIFIGREGARALDLQRIIPEQMSIVRTTVLIKYDVRSLLWSGVTMFVGLFLLNMGLVVRIRRLAAMLRAVGRDSRG